MSDLCEAFSVMAELATALGVSKIGNLPGCWEHQIDDQWWISVNGHDKAVSNRDGFNVEPFSMAITYNGWPAGICYRNGGLIAAGECANEDTFISAMQAAIQRVSGSVGHDA